MIHAAECWEIALSPVSLLELGSAREEHRVASHYAHFVEASSLVALVSCGARGPECAVWGEANCSARIVERACVLDLRCALHGDGWLGNIAECNQVRLLFLVAGATCLLRLEGRACLTSPALLAEPGPAPAAALPLTRVVVAIDTAHFAHLPAPARDARPRRRSGVETQRGAHPEHPHAEHERRASST